MQWPAQEKAHFLFLLTYTSANVFDGNVLDEIAPLFQHKIIVGDKAYQKEMVLSVPKIALLFIRL